MEATGSKDFSRRLLISAGFRDVERARTWLGSPEITRLGLDESQLAELLSQAAKPDEALPVLVRLIERSPSVLSRITGPEGPALLRLLGASPGASTAAPIMIEVLRRCFPQNFAGWESKLTEIVPSFGVKLNENPDLLAEVTAATNKSLGLK